MYKLLLFLHLLAAIFAIGPLVHATTTASRGLRTGDPMATRYAARMARIYAYTSVLVVVIGFGLMSTKDPETHQAVASFTDLWIWLSVILWLVAVGLTLGVVAPSLDKATAALGGTGSASSLTGRVAAAGGAVGLIFAVIVFLMVFQPQ
ncbi:MAG: DUF2269 family protein [Actinomycetota bacterium]|nr:DUF2269 family protein [Actinomycetota bacterium]